MWNEHSLKIWTSRLAPLNVLYPAYDLTLQLTRAKQLFRSEEDKQSKKKRADLKDFSRAELPCGLRTATVKRARGSPHLLSPCRSFEDLSTMERQAYQAVHLHTPWHTFCKTGETTSLNRSVRFFKTSSWKKKSLIEKWLDGLRNKLEMERQCLMKDGNREIEREWGSEWESEWESERKSERERVRERERKWKREREREREREIERERERYREIDR